MVLGPENLRVKPIVPEWGNPDVNESFIRVCDEFVLRTLLIDRTMTAYNHGQATNIKWATDDYAALYPDRHGYRAEDEIDIDAISSASGVDMRIVVPRVRKSISDQRRRSVEKAEVFTPSWVCNTQNNLVDESWFGRKTNLFNTSRRKPKEGELRWKRTVEQIKPPPGKTLEDYVVAPRLEVACGEGPYLTSRYDATLVDCWIDPDDRIGILDRKLRIATQLACGNRDKWCQLAAMALQGCYGFEWQGDNVLLARENMLYAVIESFQKDYGEPNGMSGHAIPPKWIRRYAEIISWNIWQMDGIKFVVPNTCEMEVAKKIADLPRQYDLFCSDAAPPTVRPCRGCKSGKPEEHEGIRCRIMDWEIGKPVLFMPPFDFKPISEMESK